MPSDKPVTHEIVTSSRRPKDGAQTAGDLEQRAISAAKTAKNMAKFRKALGIPHDQAMALNERLKLGVPILNKDRKPSDWERKPLPKPVSKAKGAK